jgi:hypothetical protein
MLMMLCSSFSCSNTRGVTGIVIDTALHVPGLMTRFSGVCSACPLLLDVLPELHKLPCFLVELGLHLADLLELCVLTPRRDWDHS